MPVGTSLCTQRLRVSGKLSTLFVYESVVVFDIELVDNLASSFHKWCAWCLKKVPVKLLCATPSSLGSLIQPDTGLRRHVTALHFGNPNTAGGIHTHTTIYDCKLTHLGCDASASTVKGWVQHARHMRKSLSFVENDDANKTMCTMFSVPACIS